MAFLATMETPCTISLTLPQMSPPTHITDGRNTLGANVTPPIPVRPDWRIRTGFRVRNHMLGLLFFLKLNLYMWYTNTHTHTYTYLIQHQRSRNSAGEHLSLRWPVLLVWNVLSSLSPLQYLHRLNTRAKIYA